MRQLFDFGPSSLLAIAMLTLMLSGCSIFHHKASTQPSAAAPSQLSSATAPGQQVQAEQNAERVRPVSVQLPPTIGSAPATAPADTTVVVSIDDTKVVNLTDEEAHGTNEVCFWNGGTNDAPTVVKAFSQMGVKLLRFPGGTTCNWYDWQRGDSPEWKDVSCQMAWNIAKAGGARLLLQTDAAQNKRSIDKTTGKEVVLLDNSGAHQAGWVGEAKQRGYQVAYWEIGNEPEMDAPGQYKSSQAKIMGWYNERYDDQARAFRAIDPNVRIMGPASTNTWFWWHEENLAKFLAAHGDKQGTGLADVISLHWYTDTAGGPWEKSRGAPQEWHHCMQFIKQTIAKYDTRDLPVYITEWNFAGGMNQQSCRWLATALGNADIAGMFMREGVKGETHFCLMGTDKNWGVLAQNGQSKDAGDPSPTYFALSMAGKIWGRILDTHVNVDEKNVFTAYSALDGRGMMNVMLINKSDKPQKAAVQFKNYNPKGAPMQVFTLQGATGDIHDTQVIYNGVTAPQPNHDPLPAPAIREVKEPLSVDLPAYSMMLLRFADAGAPIPAGTAVLPPVQAPVRDLANIVEHTEPLPPITPVNVPQPNAKMEIDGADAKWASIASMPAPFEKKDASGMKLCWTDAGLVGRIEVKEDTVQINKDEPWKKDCLELWIEKDAARSSDPGRASVQYVFFPDPDKGAGPANVRIAYGTPVDNADKIASQWKPITGGYVLEFLIPADTLAPATMKAGSKLGFNWCIDINAKPVEQFYSSKDKNAGYANPSTWGQIVLGPEK